MENQTETTPTGTNTRGMEKQPEDSMFYTNSQQEKSYSSRYLSHGIEQIVDNLSRPTQSQPPQQLSTSILFQPHNLKESTNEIPFNFHSECARPIQLASTSFPEIAKPVQLASTSFPEIAKPVQLASTSFPEIAKASTSFPEIAKSIQLGSTSFPYVSSLDRQYYPRDIPAGSGSIETLLNYPTTYSHLNTSKDYTKTVKYPSIKGDLETSSNTFNVKDTGLTMLSNLAQSRSPISESSDDKRGERIITSQVDIRNTVQYTDIANVQILQDTNTAAVSCDEMITKYGPIHNVIESTVRSLDVSNIDVRGYSDGHENHNIFDKPASTATDVISSIVDNMPYTTTENSVVYNIQGITEHTVHLTAQPQSLTPCEEDKQLEKFIFHCGGCDLVFSTLCNLQIHLESHSTSGTFMFNGNTKTAYPKFESVSVGIQTNFDDLTRDVMYETYIDRDAVNNYEQDQLHPINGILPPDESHGETSNTDKTIIIMCHDTQPNKDMGNFDPEIGEKNNLGQKSDKKEMDDRLTSDYNDIDAEYLSDDIPDRESEIDDDIEYIPSKQKFSRLSKNQNNKQITPKRGKMKSKEQKKQKYQVKKAATNMDSLNKDIKMPSDSRKKHVSILKRVCKDSKKEKETRPTKTTKKHDSFQCSKCEEKYSSQVLLRRHLREVHGVKKSFQCRSCAAQFASLEEMKEHRETHKNQIHKCDICDKVVSTAASLRDHINYHMGVKPHECSTCKKQFRTTGQLNTHIRETHESGFSQQCECCGKTFTSRYRMREHIKQCQNIKPHKCGFCGKKFIRTTQLKVHERTHTGEKPYICDICGCALTNYSSLIKHKRIHTGEKPFKCDQCSQAFTAKTTLKDHERIHTQDKRFQCQFCNRSFIKKWNLKTHLRQHTGETPYKCKICGQGYKQNVLLKTHMQSHNKVLVPEASVEVQISNTYGQLEINS